MELTVNGGNVQRKGKVCNGILASLCSCIGGRRVEENLEKSV